MLLLVLQPIRLNVQGSPHKLHTFALALTPQSYLSVGGISGVAKNLFVSLLTDKIELYLDECFHNSLNRKENIFLISVTGEIHLSESTKPKNQ
jgi:hypothetical protein